MEYIDIGVNLFNQQFEGEEETIVASASASSTAIIITGTSVKSSIQAANFIKNHRDIWSTAGVHPHDTRNCDENTIETLRTLLKNDRVVAVGECGLDYDRMYSEKETQLKWFEKQVILAEEVKKPLFLHERSAVEDFSAILKEHQDLCKRSLVHCFTGNRETVEKYLELGCFIGITGWICDDRRNGDLLDAVKAIPIRRLMAETDAPYLTPKGYGLGRRNTPENVKYVVKRIAKEKEIDEEILKEELVRNTVNFFGFWK